MGRRSGRAAAKRASAALQSTPRNVDEDEAMPDVPSSEMDTKPDADSDHKPDESDRDSDANEETGADGDGKGESEKGDGKEGGDGDAEHEPESEPSVKEPTPPPVPVIRRKRLGRPPKNRPPDWDNMITVPASEADTPRRRGRGGWRGRGGRKPAGQASVKLRQVIDKEGTEVDIANDECVLPDDPDGETKVDKDGNLKGGREYRCRTFTVLGRGERLYMLSTEPARCVGFRDSYLFFTKHLRLHKIIVGDDEKRDMIDREIIPHSYKGRSIGIVTARSVFREFGARIIVGGRRIIDDYRVADARAEGAVEGELADPADVFNPNEPYNKNQYVAWHGASAVYHQQAPAVTDPLSGKAEVKKRKVNVTNVNWMLEHAREASNFNSAINAMRKLNNEKGVYDIHTNTMQVPAIMQPTHTRIEEVTPEEAQKIPPSSTFPKLPPRLSSKVQVLDYYYESPPPGVSPFVHTRNGGHPPDFLEPFRTLGAVSDDIKDLLPPDCREAFDEALSKENEWKSRWGNEADVCSRGVPIIDRAIVPFR